MVTIKTLFKGMVGAAIGLSQLFGATHAAIPTSNSAPAASKTISIQDAKAHVCLAYLYIRQDNPSLETPPDLSDWLGVPRDAPFMEIMVAISGQTLLQCKHYSLAFDTTSYENTTTEALRSLRTQLYALNTVGVVLLKDPLTMVYRHMFQPHLENGWAFIELQCGVQSVVQLEAKCAQRT